MHVMQAKYTGEGSRVSPSFEATVTLFQETDKATLGRKIRVNFLDANGKDIEAIIPLEYSYANFVLKVGNRVRILGSVPPGAEFQENQVCGFAITCEGSEVRWIFQSPNLASCTRWLDILRNEGCCMADFAQRFELTQILGNGGASIVFFGQILDRGGAAQTNRVAVKSASSDAGKRQLRLESRMLASLCHKNIIRSYGLYEVKIKDVQCFGMVLEHLDGGDLYNFLDDEGMDEITARGIMKQLLEATAFCHELGVVHRDIKMTNLLCVAPTETQPKIRVRLSDFGLAACTWEAEEMQRRCGSPGFIAPEVLKRDGYGTKADCFSLGVVLFQMLTGEAPFRAQDMREVLRLNVMGLTDLTPLDVISADARELVLGLCETDPSARMSCKQALSSKWITGLAPVVRQPNLASPEKKKGSRNSRREKSDKKSARWDRGELFDSTVLPLHNLLPVPGNRSSESEFGTYSQSRMSMESFVSSAAESSENVEYYSGTISHLGSDEADVQGIALYTQPSVNVSTSNSLMAFDELPADAKLQYATDYMGMAKEYWGGKDRGPKPSPEAVKDMKQAFGWAAPAPSAGPAQGAGDGRESPKLEPPRTPSPPNSASGNPRLRQLAAADASEGHGLAPAESGRVTPPARDVTVTLPQINPKATK
jgi:serine/threonine protein kinase